MANLKTTLAAVLALVRQYQDEFKINEVMFALPKPEIRGGYGNPHPRLIFAGPHGQYRVKTVLNGRICDYTLTDGKLLCCLPKSCVLRQDAENLKTVSVDVSRISIVFMKHCIRIVYKLNGESYWYHSRHPLSTGGNLLLRGLSAFAREKRSQQLLSKTVAALLEIIVDDLEKDMEESGKALKTYQQALYLMHNQFQSDISRESIAAQLKITPSHLSRLFRNSDTGGFIDALIRMRLEYAVELMSDLNVTESEVAEMAGFHSCSYFIKVFRKYFGTTPAHFCRSGGSDRI